MKRIKPILAITIALTSVFAQSAQATVLHKDALVGTWILEKSDNPLPSGQVVPYCTGVHGMIIYTKEGYVSVALNCGPKGEQEEPADISGRKFFYAGPYSFDGQQVEHTMFNASQPDLIGKSFVREVTIQGNRLILSGDNQGQKFSAHWIRARKD